MKAAKAAKDKARFGSFKAEFCAKSENQSCFRVKWAVKFESASQARAPAMDDDDELLYSEEDEVHAGCS